MLVLTTEAQNKERKLTASSNVVYCSTCSPQIQAKQRRRARGVQFCHQHYKHP